MMTRRVRTFTLGAAALAVLLAFAFTGAGHVAAQTATALLVKDTDNPARHVFKKFMPLGATNPAFQQFTVPSGKRIVLEYVAARGCVTPGPGPIPEVVIVESNPLSGAALGSYRFPATGRLNAAGPFDCSAFNHQLRAYLDPGSQVTVAYNGATSSAEFEVTLSGYILDAR